MFALMLQKMDIYKCFLKQKMRKYSNILVTIFILIHVFTPVISLLTFNLQLDKHLIECQQNRHHKDHCKASCILAEMMPGQNGNIPKKTIVFTSPFVDLFFKEHQFLLLDQSSEILVSNPISNYLINYTSPFIGINSPPPK